MLFLGFLSRIADFDSGSCRPHASLENSREYLFVCKVGHGASPFDFSPLRTGVKFSLTTLFYRDQCP